MVCGMCLVPFAIGFGMAWSLQNKRLAGISYRVQQVEAKSLLDKLPAGIRIWLNERLEK